MRRVILVLVGVFGCQIVFSWGFYGHRIINRNAVFLLPPEMMVFFKPNIDMLTEHAVDPDKRRYMLKEEGPRHYMDMDHYQPLDSIPVSYSAAIKKYSEDSLMKHGIVPWWIQIMVVRLTKAFEKKDQTMVLKLSADLGHYVGDLHVPLHASSNHNGQLTNQHGIHGFWESRIPELFAESQFDLIVGKAAYVKSVSELVWRVIRQSARAADSVLKFEQLLNNRFRTDAKFSYEYRNGIVVRQYSTAYSTAYHQMLNGMVERRMRESIKVTASLWYSAWVDAGQPSLKGWSGTPVSSETAQEWEELQKGWMNKGGSTGCNGSL